MNDLSQVWARNRLNQAHPASGDDVAHWCRFLQRNQSEVSTLDWTAFCILSGDESAWPTATQNTRRETLSSQWNQLHHFEEIFFELTSFDRRRSYQVLQAYLTSNPPALVRLSRYEPFLDLDFSVADSVFTDEMQLVVWLARISVSSPIRREEVLAKTLDRISDEPIRWRRAAIAVLKQPEYAMIEPDVIKYIVSMLPYEDLHIERQRSRRRKFQLRYGAKIVIHRIMSLSLSIPWIALAVSSAMLTLVFIEGRSSLPPDRTDEELKRQKLISGIMAEFESRSTKSKVNVDPLEPSDLEPKPASSTNDDPAPADRETQSRWRETAIVEGNVGLDNIQKQLENGLLLVTLSGFQSAIDDQRTLIRQFDRWRRLIGNDLAARKSSSSVDR